MGRTRRWPDPRAVSWQTVARTGGGSGAQATANDATGEAGADCNPYLAFAATLATGLHGIDTELELSAAFGEAVAGHYAHAGEWEQREYDRRVTDREPIRNFERAQRKRRSTAIVRPHAGA